MSMSVAEMYKEIIDQMLELRLYDIQESDITNYDDSAVSDIEIDYTTQS